MLNTQVRQSFGHNQRRKQADSKFPSKTQVNEVGYRLGENYTLLYHCTRYPFWDFNSRRDNIIDQGSLFVK